MHAFSKRPSDLFVPSACHLIFKYRASKAQKNFFRAAYKFLNFCRALLTVNISEMADKDNLHLINDYFKDHVLALRRGAYPCSCEGCDCHNMGETFLWMFFKTTCNRCHEQVIRNKIYKYLVRDVKLTDKRYIQYLPDDGAILFSSYSDFIKLNKETRDRVVNYAYWYLRDKNNELAALKVEPDTPRGVMRDYVTSCLLRIKNIYFTVSIYSMITWNTILYGINSLFFLNSSFVYLV